MWGFTKRREEIGARRVEVFSVELRGPLEGDRRVEARRERWLCPPGPARYSRFASRVSVGPECLAPCHLRERDISHRRVHQDPGGHPPLPCYCCYLPIGFAGGRDALGKGECGLRLAAGNKYGHGYVVAP